MKRRVVWFVVAVVAVGITVSLVALPQRSQWTTSSEQAREELLAGIAAAHKLYHVDAARHFERALALDPDFIAAKLYLVDHLREVDQDAAARMLDEVLAASTADLSDREQLLIERVRAMREKRPEDAEDLVDAYLDEHPDDPYVLYIKAMSAWGAAELDAAERLFRRLVELEPNWVIAYNQLGYIAMRQGRFAEAEEYFTSYRFVAPDQANPHDSLGELYTIQGRYDEAIASFERALDIRPDFLASYDHLATAFLVSGRYRQAEEIASRLASQDDVPADWLRSLSCVVRIAELVDARAWSEIAALRDECLWKPQQGYLTVMVHRAAVQAGELEVALDIEGRIQQLLEYEKQYQKWMVSVEAMLDHMRGVRAAIDGDLTTADALLTAADERFEYSDQGAGLFKLVNRLLLVEVRFAAGRDAEAHTLLSKVRAVNPALVEEFEREGFRTLGLQRR